ncbi:MAG: hypothetical protein K6T57_12725 [Thermaceae bacterium]|nr:hypothetical protein [Thermaceae bacterium]
MNRYSVLAVGILLGAALAQTPGIPEPKSVGDIPDTQAFVRYANPAGYSLEVPEGWARTVRGGTVRFEAKFNSVTILLQKAPATPSLASVQAAEVKALQKDSSVKIKALKVVKLSSGSAILVSYESQSGVNAVTGQKVTLENDLYVLYRNGQQALLTLSAPKGADNADAWRQMANSFTWGQP